MARTNVFPSPNLTLRDLPILLVDDDVEIRQWLRAVLIQDGCANIIEASSAEEALKILTNVPIGIVLSDLNMPVIDGLEFLKLFKKLQCANGIPFIFLTSDDGRESVMRAIEAEVTDYVIKKSARTVLVKKIIQAINLSAAGLV